MKLNTRKQQNKRLLQWGILLLIVIISIAIAVAWISIKRSEGSSGQAVASRFISALENKDINKALKYTDPSKDTSKTVVIYNVAMQNIGKDYRVIQKESKDGKESYIFESERGKRYPFIRVVVEEKADNWIVTNFLPNSTKPSAFSGK